MKEAELRKHTTCSLCLKKIGESGSPLFSVVTVKRYGVHFDSIQRQDGLAAVLGGNPFLASVMGPDEDMAELMNESTRTVCETCFTGKEILVAQLAFSQ